MRYNQNPEEHAANLAAIAIELTMQTGAVITSKVTDNIYDELIFPDGTINAELNNDNRWYFHPDRPQGTPPNTSGPDYSKISIDAARPPEAIARDLLRRLYPSAREYWHGWKVITEKHARDLAQVTATVEALEAAGMTRSTWRGRDTSPYMHGTGIEVEIYTSGPHNIKISSATLQQVIKILDILHRPVGDIPTGKEP